MSYASLVGLPDTPVYGDKNPACDLWYTVRSKFDLFDEPRAEMSYEVWAMGDQPTYCDFESEDSQVFVTEYLHGQWATHDVEPAQPFPCDDSCHSCWLGRMVERAFGPEAAIEHFLVPHQVPGGLLFGAQGNP